MIRTCIAKATAVAALVLGVTVLVAPAAPVTPATAATAPAATTEVAPAPLTQTGPDDTGTWGG
ncbi:hypothetical protein OG898_15240 [Streptomyces sp. NBC_00193]|uniref:hypothetical protein n=1 Tax=unclassified Streptomyces TaxID=2593676 RepID=UPI00224FE04B|nr:MULTISPECIES: hypothetical protein [unclassified Streptomyces]MCX5124645.1 hypothetical protein [Streptomyces sp. NBC_00347]MCX5297823.1 hypothetical protein [Streptomyces sp. NBC_00193]